MTQSMEELKAQLAKLQKENEALKKQAAGNITFKVSPKKACSVYGLQRLPVTLYKNTWKILLDKKEELLAFLEEHDAELASKDDPKDNKKKCTRALSDTDSDSDCDSDT